MKKINNIFDCLENAEGNDMERITKNAPKLDDKQLDRLLDMSERKYNIKRRNEINADIDSSDDYRTEAEGVEAYNRPVWFRFGAIAAALVLTGGIAAAGLRILKNRTEVPNVPSVPNIAATSVTTDTVTTDKDNADVTTVTADLSATATNSETTAISSETTSAVQSSQQDSAPANTEAPAQQTTAAPAVNALTENECYNVIDSEVDALIEFEEIINIPCRDYLDFSDTFTATARVTHETFGEGHPLLDEPNEFTLKFVHYVDPRFSTIDELRDYVVYYNEHWNSNKFQYIDKMFNQTIVPGQVVTNELYIPEQIYVYTVYDGKIYRAVSNDLDSEGCRTHDEYYTSERMSLRWGHDYLKNITDNSFEAYRINENGSGSGGYYGRYRYYHFDGTSWYEDASSERDLSDAECRAIIAGQ